MINIYYTNVSSFDSSENYLHLLPADARQKFGRFRNKSDAHLFLAGRLLLLHGLANLNRNDIKLDHIMYTDSGKPYFIDSSISFSISHSGDWAFCAIGLNCTVGIDIERKNDINFSNFQSVVSAAENDKLENAINKKDLFYSFWTTKEAIVKADGCGVATNLSAIEATEKSIIFNARQWHLQQYHMVPGYAICLVCDQLISNKPFLKQCFF